MIYAHIIVILWINFTTICKRFTYKQKKVFMKHVYCRRYSW